MNKAFVLGRITADPELKMTSNDKPVCEVTVAHNRVFKTSDGEKKEDTTFINVVFWNARATTIAQHAVKGSQILVEGRLEESTWQTQDGQKRSRIRIVADNFEFVGSKPSKQTEKTAEATA